MEVDDAFLWGIGVGGGEVAGDLFEESESVFDVGAFEEVIILVGEVGNVFHDEFGLLEVVI